MIQQSWKSKTTKHFLLWQFQFEIFSTNSGGILLGIEECDGIKGQTRVRHDQA